MPSARPSAPLPPAHAGVSGPLYQREGPEYSNVKFKHKDVRER